MIDVSNTEEPVHLHAPSRLQMLQRHPQLPIQKPLSKMCFRLSYRLRVPLFEEPGYFVHLFLR